MSTDHPVLSLEDVDVHFEKDGGGLNPFTDRPTVRAVDGVDLDISSNDVVAIVGESGSGKTTLGKTAVGLQQPSAGTIKYRGQDIWQAKKWNSNASIPFDEIRRSLQIIHQDPGAALNPNRTVLSSLAAPLKRWQPDLSSEDREARILHFIERVGMSPPHDYAHRYPHQLSGGEKQRVALVRALLMNPDVILADEAVSALDVSLRVEMMDLMLELQSQFDTSFLFISHDLSNARYIAEHADGRLGVMYLGELVELGPADEVLQNPQHPYTKVLKWATPELGVDEGPTEPPIREIDIPDPVNPPTGCRFHTRCPNATDQCRRATPEVTAVDDGTGRHRVACYRSTDEDAYWDSDPLDGAEL
ncbi:peptide/nickel transport system ATP-binding protein [Haladaptatus litoreus]|uniref:Peptide/nickel transport system ATP-binding protein n=1 Tax=Haladaptatus litoreus TaxID=553468 RepID=A0A1N7CP85_9EURY|nr:ABC transporter ATP-binding protein [Haladaptatus litoreus]SIR65403.1 peptide/nickel transport system ATP-binding protein [Haladaptatus litoreus]